MHPVFSKLYPVNRVTVRILVKAYTAEEHQRFKIDFKTLKGRFYLSIYLFIYSLNFLKWTNLTLKFVAL